MYSLPHIRNSHKREFCECVHQKMSYACLTMDVVGKKSHLLRMLATFCHCLPTCHNYSRQQSNKKESGANLPSLCLKNTQKHKVESTCFESQWAPTTFQSKASGTNLTKIFLFLFILLQQLRGCVHITFSLRGEGGLAYFFTL